MKYPAEISKNTDMQKGEIRLKPTVFSGGFVNQIQFNKYQYSTPHTILKRLDK
jgi:hypothetical protein